MHLQYYFGDDFKQFEEYLSSIEHTVFECKKDTPLSGVGAPLDKEYYVLEGMIRTSFIHESGHIKAFAFYGPYTFAPLYYPGDYKIESSLIFTADTDLKALAFDRKLLGAISIKIQSLIRLCMTPICGWWCCLSRITSTSFFQQGLKKFRISSTALSLTVTTRWF